VVLEVAAVAAAAGLREMALKVAGVATLDLVTLMAVMVDQT
jgi:hypothetical protein